MEGLNDLRQSVYDVAKECFNTLPEGVLIKRVDRSEGSKCVPQKYAADVYNLYRIREYSGYGGVCFFVRSSISRSIRETETSKKQ